MFQVAIGCSGRFHLRLVTALFLLLSLGYSAATAMAEENQPSSTESEQHPDTTTELAEESTEKNQVPVPQLLNTACDYEGNQQTTWFDRTHHVISRSVCAQAVRFDRFFGNVRSGDDYTSSRMRIRNSLRFEKEEDVEVEFVPRVRARFHLPNFEEQFNIIIFDDTSQEDSLSSAEESFPQDEDEPNRYSAALRWIVRTSEQLQLDFDVGARFNSGIEPLVRLRYRKTFPVSDYSLTRLSNTLYWRKTEEFGNRLELDYERIVTSNTLLQWHTGGTYSEVSEGIEWNKRVTFYQALDERRAVSYSIGLNGNTLPYPIVENYGVSVRFRKNVLRSWLFVELEPSINWPLDRDRDLTPSITFRLEANFGEAYEPNAKERLEYHQERNGTMNSKPSESANNPLPATEAQPSDQPEP